MSVRKLLDDDWEDDPWKQNDEVAEAAGKAVQIGVGIVIAIVVCILVVVIVSVIVCVYCVCKKRQGSSGTVVRSGGPQQVTTYQFQQAPPVQMGAMHSGAPPPQGYPPYPPQGYPPATAGPYPPPGPPQAYPPMSAGGFVKPSPGVASPPPYSPQPAPMGYSEKQSASAPPME